jgi:hypothetical protein
VQYLVIGIAGVLLSEPWPTFALPGFKKVYTTEDQAQVLKPFFYAELEDQPGEYTQISEFQLFDGIQVSQLQGFLRKHFSEPQEYSKVAKLWIQQQLELGYPAINSAGLRVIWKRTIYEQSGDSMFVHSVDDVEEITISFRN